MQMLIQSKYKCLICKTCEKSIMVWFFQADMHRDKRCSNSCGFQFLYKVQTFQEENLSKLAIIQLDMFHTHCTFKTNMKLNSKFSEVFF